MKKRIWFIVLISCLLCGCIRRGRTLDSQLMDSREVDFSEENENNKEDITEQWEKGFPIWWYVAPTIINTFLEAYDFSGKKIVLFATSGGSGFGNTVKELQSSAPDAVITEGRLLNCGTKQEISEWVNSL